MKSANTLYGQNVAILYVKMGGTYSYRHVSQTVGRVIPVQYSTAVGCRLNNFSADSTKPDTARAEAKLHQFCAMPVSHSHISHDLSADHCQGQILVPVFLPC